MEICTETIMAQIKAEIAEKGLVSDTPDFDSVPYERPVAVSKGEASLDAADKTLAFMSAHYYVQPYKPLLGSRPAVFAKKVIRKLTKFYVEPVVFEQNDFNAHTVSALRSIRGVIGKHFSDSEALGERIAALEKQNTELLGRIDSLESELSALRNKNGKKGRK